MKPIREKLERERAALVVAQAEIMLLRECLASIEDVVLGVEPRHRLSNHEKVSDIRVILANAPPFNLHT